MSQDEFEDDIALFLNNLYPAIEKAVTIILNELGIAVTHLGLSTYLKLLSGIAFPDYFHKALSVIRC